MHTYGFNYVLSLPRWKRPHREHKTTLEQRRNLVELKSLRYSKLDLDFAPTSYARWACTVYIKVHSD